MYTRTDRLFDRGVVLRLKLESTDWQLNISAQVFGQINALLGCQPGAKTTSHYDLRIELIWIPLTNENSSVKYR